MTSKIYIAGPMTGYPDFNYPAFIDAEKILIGQGWEVLNPVHSEKENYGAGYQQETWTWYLRQGMKMVADADSICLLPGWEESRGANAELYMARVIEATVYLLIDGELVIKEQE